MAKKNPIEMTRYINSKYKEYLRSSFSFGNSKLQNLFTEQLEKEDLVKGPYVALTLPFKRGRSISTLMEDGVVCKSFTKLGNVNFNRPLYLHQEEALRKINAGKSAIVTTGTGSGKTECFLFPIINEILYDIEKGNNEVGIRAIFLYPMNALVNDQIERVRQMLADCPDITYGFFTGETPEKVAATYREKYGEELGTQIPPNELVSREEIRKTPPHLLFTNYSMLEYLLIRPNDYTLFESAKLKNWKFVVLDEAHSYYGSLGIELSLLMRRLTGLADNKPRFILTSATLGEKGKSENEIIGFAKNLTSSNFDIQDIIFSKRIPLNNLLMEYSVNGADYTNLKKNIDSFGKIKDIAKCYGEFDAKDIKECLYELLIRDQNVHKLYEVLSKNSKSFKTILKEFTPHITEVELIDLIDLINNAEKDGIGLFDLKYHTFVRPLSGAYISLGKEQQLSLTKTNILNELKAFEIGNCRYCSTPYIIGRIQRNEIDKRDYLYQNKEIDIYENYGDNKFALIDYFLLEKPVEEDTEELAVEEHTVCAKCGAIRITNNLNAKKCNCGTEYEFSVYKVIETKQTKEDVFTNNISKSPCCGHKSRNGMIKNLNLGKDEGTALIAQILYEAIDEGDVEEKKKQKPLLRGKSERKDDITERKAKQFLTFSDSRQQASFAAVFLDSNHVRMLRKRLIWEIIEKANYKNISVDEMVAELTSMIKERDLFPEAISAYKSAWITVMVDLLRVDGIYDGEGLGLYYFDLDLAEVMDRITEEDVEESLGKYNITKSDLATLIQVVLGVFKITPAINYTKSTLTPEEKSEALEYRRFDNYIMYNSPKALKDTRSFLPVKNNDNSIVRYVKKVCNCDSEEAKEILDIIFNGIAVDGEILKKHATKESYQIEASKYIIRNYKTSKYYKCTKCGGLTPHNIHDVCVSDRCDGKLYEVNPDEVLDTNYYRKQYKTKKIESVVIKEHTAQLERKKAKAYQMDFRNKKINILSCSTTFEMGIDIGDLETVFMRNVPPSPANYVQRAGRAGRRKDSSSYVLTYCGTGSHDYTYFCEPEKMISGIIRPPYFNVVNDKIILRHLMATCLGYFFRENPQYFGNVESFVFNGGIKVFKDYIGQHPICLNAYINKVLPESVYSDYRDFKWFDRIKGNDEKMESFIASIKDIISEYEKAKKEAVAEEKFAEAEYYSKQIQKIYGMNLIEALSQYCVIPKYGFPVDVVDLQVYKDGMRDASYDLNRDLRIAISEYAPDSEIIVDKIKYTSKYVTLRKATVLPKYYFHMCPKCRKINMFYSTRSIEKCKYCGEELQNEKVNFFIEPVYGFKTGVTKESNRMKPKRSFAGEVSYIGGGTKDERHLEMGEVLKIETSTNDELFVVNKSDFYMCFECGYSDIAKSNLKPLTLKKEHKNCKQQSCKCDELQQIKLGHLFKTDVARVTIPLLKLNGREEYAKALSFLYALLEGISSALGIERNDIDGLLEVNLDKSSYDILIYDNVPGGAGHVKRLVNLDSVINSLNNACKKVSQQCCDEDTSCYNCLRNYYNQSHHNKLKRSYAKAVIDTILGSIDVLKGI
ncbi:MAG: DEAD/DEAH box helicase [Bacilli bacterium]|nr:DEAD/DEAH box helicase [Bacilli bacterium]